MIVDSAARKVFAVREKRGSSELLRLVDSIKDVWHLGKFAIDVPRVSSITIAESAAYIRSLRFGPQAMPFCR
jgi:hypothetical protein